MPIPAFILSGFLGSGKTTLLIRLLQEVKVRGARPGILMNELGKQDVDGLAVSGHTDGAIEKLLDGCVCCDKKSELAEAVRALLRTGPDVLFVELTGVADPQEIADVFAHPDLAERIDIKRIITVLDAEYTLDYNNLFLSDRRLIRTLRRQIEGADLLVVNKTDLVSPRKLAKIEPFVRRHNGHAELVHAVRCEIGLAPLLDGIAPAGLKPSRAHFPVLHDHSGHSPAAAHDHRPAESGSYSQLRAVTLTLPEERRLARERLEEFLQRWGGQIVRAKGYVRLEGHASVQFLQYAGKRIAWEPASYPGTPYLVLIGIDLNERRLAAEWAELCRAVS